eukprot:GHUV01038281.1.p1 GENE.GHUV01038281.1~~GHUV01038281.1.p1  ORF type:complete len:134 (+),score=14.48 GHUV01038281.1:1133-1534(+)
MHVQVHCSDLLAVGAMVRVPLRLFLLLPLELHQGKLHRVRAVCVHKSMLFIVPFGRAQTASSVHENCALIALTVKHNHPGHVGDVGCCWAFIMYMHILGATSSGCSWCWDLEPAVQQGATRAASNIGILCTLR